MAERLGRTTLEADRLVDARIGVVAAVGVVDKRAEEGRLGFLDSAQDGVLLVRPEVTEASLVLAGAG